MSKLCDVIGDGIRSRLSVISDSDSDSHSGLYSDVFSLQYKYSISISLCSRFAAPIFRA